MKQKITLGPRGVEALVALCNHVVMNGSFSEDGKWLADLMINIAEAEDEAKAFRGDWVGGLNRSRKHMAKIRKKFEEQTPFE